MNPPAEPIRLVGEPMLNRAGDLFGWFAAVWIPIGMVGVIYTTNAANVADWPIWARAVTFVLIFVIGFGPFAIGRFSISKAGRPYRSRPAFRWMFTSIQPSATLGRDGLEICLPPGDCRRFAWDEIVGMEPPIEWLRSAAGEHPDLDLTNPDGKVLTKVPPSLYNRPESVSRDWRLAMPGTLAEWVVKMRPDRYVLIDMQHDGRHFWFELASAAAIRAGAESTSESERPT